MKGGSCMNILFNSSNDCSVVLAICCTISVYEV